MKTWIALIALMLGAMFAPSAATAQKGDEAPVGSRQDAELVARYLALNPPTSCTAYGQYWEGMVYNYTVFSFKFYEETGEIFSLILNGTELVVDENLPGFPSRADGTPFKEFWIYWAECYGTRSKYVRIMEGAFSDSSLAEKESIVIPFGLSNVSFAFLPVGLSDGGDLAGARLFMDGGEYGILFDPYLGDGGGFWIYADPINPFTYYVEDKNGIRIAGGVYDPFGKKDTPTPASSGVGALLPENVVEINLSETGYPSWSRSEMTLNSIVKRNGLEVPAKVFFADTPDGICVEAYANRKPGLRMEIRLASTGELVSEQGAGEIGASYQHGGKVIITVMLNDGGKPPKGYTFRLSAYGGGGCTKG